MRDGNAVFRGAVADVEEDGLDGDGRLAVVLPEALLQHPGDVQHRDLEAEASEARLRRRRLVRRNAHADEAPRLFGCEDPVAHVAVQRIVQPQEVLAHCAFTRDGQRFGFQVPPRRFVEERLRLDEGFGQVVHRLLRGDGQLRYHLGVFSCGALASEAQRCAAVAVAGAVAPVPTPSTRT